jgi:hypothetical protein
MPPQVGFSANTATLFCAFQLPRELGEPDEAHRGFERAWQVFEQSLGPTHPFVIENLVQHAELLRKARDEEGAKKYLDVGLLKNVSVSAASTG